MLALIFAALLAAPARAAGVAASTAPAPGVPASTAPVTALSNTTAEIAEIHIHRLNVFDPAVPGEDWWPFYMADKIHVITQERVVRREMLIGPGDRYSALSALQSERNLRSLGIFRKAEIHPVQRQDGKLDLDVRTQDSWTLNINLSAGTEGGQSFYSYGVAEDNLLGSGKSVSASHFQNGPIRGTSVGYDDSRVGGTRFHLTPSYAKTNQGDLISTALYRPFFALETPYALGTSWTRNVGETTLYSAGDTLNKFFQRTQKVTATYGARLEPDDFFVQRVEAGWHFDKEQFAANADTLQLPVPADRTLSGPVVGYSWIQPRYIKETYINKMERVEDFNLGNEFYAFGGYMSSELGADRDRWIFNALDQQGLFLGPGRFALGQIGAVGRVAGGHADNVLFFGNCNLFWKEDFLYPQTWVAHFETNRGRNLDGENQVILGGNTGLRGYKNYAFVGGKSALFNVENRFFLPGEYFHLFRFGGAAFIETGSVVPENIGVTWKRFNSDAGLGLRFAPTRSESGNIVRADLAYALNAGPGGSRWVVSIRGSQAFQIFNSSTKNIQESPSFQLLPPQSD